MKHTCPKCEAVIEIDDRRVASYAAGLAFAARKRNVAGPGRPKSTDRCACGQFTTARAKARNHRCDHPGAIGGC